MDWSNHVDAVQASWVLKYLHPSKSLWKSLLDVLMFRDDDGRLILGGERELLMCPLTPERKSTSYLSSSDGGPLTLKSA